MFQIKVVEKIKIHVLCSVTFYSENRAVYEIMSKNMEEPERLQITIWWRVTCWIIKPTRAQAHANARAPTVTSTQAHTHWHTYRNMYDLLLSTGKLVSCTDSRLDNLETSHFLFKPKVGARKIRPTHTSARFVSLNCCLHPTSHWLCRSSALFRPVPISTLPSSCVIYSSTWKLWAGLSSETSTDFYRNTHLSTREESILYTYLTPLKFVLILSPHFCLVHSK